MPARSLSNKDKQFKWPHYWSLARFEEILNHATVNWALARTTKVTFAHSLWKINSKTMANRLGTVCTLARIEIIWRRVAIRCSLAITGCTAKKILNGSKHCVLSQWNRRWLIYHAERILWGEHEYTHAHNECTSSKWSSQRQKKKNRQHEKKTISPKESRVFLFWAISMALMRYGSPSSCTSVVYAPNMRPFPFLMSIIHCYHCLIYRLTLISLGNCIFSSSVTCCVYFIYWRQKLYELHY